MSSMSCKSEINSRGVVCGCGLKAPIRTSHTPWSKGRKIYGCGNYKEQGVCVYVSDKGLMEFVGK